MSGNLVPSPTHGLVFRPPKRPKHRVFRFFAAAIVMLAGYGLTYVSQVLGALLIAAGFIFMMVQIVKLIKNQS